MKKIGIYLASNQLSGGIFQYNINFIKALHDLRKYFEIYYVYTDKIWEKFIPKNSKKFYLKKNIIKVVFINSLLKIIFFKKIIYYFILFLNKNLNLNLLSLKKKKNFLDQLECKYFIFPSQDILSYQIETKSIVAIHDLMHIFHPYFYEYRNKEAEIRNIHYNLIAKKSYKILVDSESGKEHVLTNLKNSTYRQVEILPFYPTTYLYNKKNINVFKKYKIPKHYIFYPAHFWEHKNHEVLINAISICKQKNFLFNCVFVGGKKNNYKKILQTIKILNLEKQFYVLGYVDENDMYSLYKNSLVTAYVSLLGPTNIPPLEAMFAESPLIYSDVYGMREQMQYAGIPVNPNNAKEISNLLIKIFTNKLFRNKMIQNGLKRIKDINELEFKKKIYQILK